ncbi:MULTISPECIES: hypothetical protein [Methylocaldum]|uniref:hypothetical protein n=1 Tax=Methylocaldum sp. RMAD-M TaxID=2806557 RepID=UPI000A322E30|nr:hypothetical protein [Methylocaldum sp. RMAD-M]MBP1152992.1 hypothetical protein [Methylocaldum sp. RMAD-M]
MILLLIHKLLPGRQVPWRARLETLFRRWLPRVLRILLVGFGMFLMVDVVLRALGLELPFGE